MASGRGRYITQGRSEADRYIEERVGGGYTGDIRGRYIEKMVGGGYSGDIRGRYIERRV